MKAGRRRGAAAALGVVAAALVGSGPEALGHGPYTSYLKIDLGADEVVSRFSFDVLTLFRIAPELDADGDGAVTATETEASRSEIERYLRERTHLDLDDAESDWGEPLPLEWPVPGGAPITRGDWHQTLIPFSFRQGIDPPRLPRDVVVTFDVFIELGLKHQVLGEFLIGGADSHPVTFTLDAPDYLFDVAYALDPDEANVGAVPDLPGAQPGKAAFPDVSAPADSVGQSLHPGAETGKHGFIMKKFLVLLIVVGGVASAFFFYDPYLKPYLGPLVEKIAGKSPDPAPPAAPTPAPDPGKSPATPAPPTPAKSGPVAKAPATPTPPPAAPPKSEIDLLVEQRYPMPQFIALSQIVNDWKSVPERAFPEQVAIQENVPFVLRGADGSPIGSSVAVPGTLVKPVSLRGETLIIASLANQSMRSEIAVDKTDFKQLVEKRYNDFVLSMTNRVREQREKAKQALLAKPETLAALKGGGGGSFDASGDPRMIPVKASLSKGDTKAFTLEEAVGFRWNGSERINGDKHKGTFDTVTVKYEAKTIFGVFPGEAKCLLQGGRVVGWIDPITEEEMI